MVRRRSVPCQQVKAGKENFAETNMTVITADGKLYSFIIRYSAEPARLHIELDSAKSVFEKIAIQERSVHGIRDRNYDMNLCLRGLFIDKDILYYQLELENLSNSTYDIDLLSFFIKDRKQSKRTASQELRQVPLHIYGNSSSVAGQAKQAVAGTTRTPNAIQSCAKAVTRSGAAAATHSKTSGMRSRQRTN